MRYKLPTDKSRIISMFRRKKITLSFPSINQYLGLKEKYPNLNSIVRVNGGYDYIIFMFDSLDTFIDVDIEGIPFETQLRKSKK